ncbi:MAG: bifunctional [glutamine synthetase] adenylyltransferase/[glutamine synthetase]-adenylyl-L-tyrosine phosphorylase [Promicromonosporaceae bacterium]|nr:bifunctional [glutamine synthetase] adenylyltransferase/[glutamine synthetase]-adenylyl-L-tyrosine phosphorylase [Promicromonosporaceae bacterium]
MTGRTISLNQRLLRAGLLDLSRATRLWGDLKLTGVLPAADETVLDALRDCADPDLALLGLVRLAARAEVRPCLSQMLTAPDGTANCTHRRRLLAVLGASAALADEVVRHPELLARMNEPGLGIEPDVVRAELLRAVGADPAAERPIATSPDAVVSLRRAYRARLACIAADDLTAPDPLVVMPSVGSALADLAAAALEAALAVARAQHPDHAAARLTVIGMGKIGGRELNYVSDVDVIYVVAPGERIDGEQVTEDEAIAVGIKLATTLQQVCEDPDSEPALWQVDIGLRPEGRDGSLVRTLPSLGAYYEKWAAAWEFQALLKARPAAGEAVLGQEFRAAIDPSVWQAASHESFVADAQAMRRRVESNVPRHEAERQIKLGAGGLRDVEFTVQLLQLVHGRTDATVRAAGTLNALSALASAGYVGRDAAEQLAQLYRFLRALEHRVQLYQLRRTHLLPTANDDLRRIARSLRLTNSEELTEAWRVARREVRALHETLFYRPLLPAFAGLSTDEANLTPEAAHARLSAIGFRDPAQAMRHIQALTKGTSRRAALQRQLLPVLLGWFAQEADPDAGLLAFRRISDEVGAAHWYLKLLRDSGLAAKQLARVLASSQYLADAFAASPKSVRWLDDPAELVPRGLLRLADEVTALLARADTPKRAAERLRAIRRRELVRAGAGELLGVLDPVAAAAAISDVTDLALISGLQVATDSALAELGFDTPPANLLVVALGRLGGREMGYASDADVMFVYQSIPGADSAEAARFALLMAARLRELLGGAGTESPLNVDADLRPEGKQGPLVRSLESYAEYYQRWANVWEVQALLRARPLSIVDPISAASPLATQFTELIDPLRYPQAGLGAAKAREIRRLKARMEAERLPRGVEPQRHVKLGPGGLADVEWTAQLLQLRHACEIPRLRTTSTVTALEATAAAGLLAPEDATALLVAWNFASRLRSALVLWSGRTSGSALDVLPHDHRDLNGVARLLGDVGTGEELAANYLRTARLARAVVERVFYAD